MTERLSPAELAHRVRVRGHRLEERQALEFLVEWERRGIAEQRLGRWSLTESGRAMFSSWAELPLDDDQELAA